METILRAENISRSFKINDSTTVDALKDINLEVEKNKLVVLRGRSGSGKTTLIIYSVRLTGRPAEMSTLTVKDNRTYRQGNG